MELLLFIVFLVCAIVTLASYVERKNKRDIQKERVQNELQEQEMPEVNIQAVSAATGYIYILINPAMKDLLKIGKTTRSPEERAVEISQGTGIPTPFVVAYEEQVHDCDLAERIIHDRLKEYRYSRDREFFQIPLKDAVRVAREVAEELEGGPRRTV